MRLHPVRLTLPLRRPETQAAMRRIEADISRRQFLGGSAAVIGMFAGFGLALRELRA